MYKQLASYRSELGKVTLNERVNLMHKDKYVLLVEDATRGTLTRRTFDFLADADRAWGEAAYQLDPARPATKANRFIKQCGNIHCVQMWATYDTRYLVLVRARPMLSMDRVANTRAEAEQLYQDFARRLGLAEKQH